MDTQESEGPKPKEYRYRNCDFCGESYRDEHTHMSHLCTPCWYIPEHIPESQHEQFYRIRQNEKSEHKKMLLLRQTNSKLHG